MPADVPTGAACEQEPPLGGGPLELLTLAAISARSLAFAASHIAARDEEVETPEDALEGERRSF